MCGHLFMCVYVYCVTSDCVHSCVSLCVCIFVCITGMHKCLCTCVLVYISLLMSKCVPFLWICACLGVCVGLHVCESAWEWECILICVYCVSVHTYVFMCVSMTVCLDM